MADLTVDGLSELSSPAANDEIGIWDVSAAQFMKIQRSTLVGATITGSGTIATGGYTLTVPATGTAALVARAQTFTISQTVAPTATDIDALILNMPASNTRYGLVAQYDGTNRLLLQESDAVNRIVLVATDLGSDVAGPYISIRNNTNASKPGAGFVQLYRKSGSIDHIWPDASGVLRIHTVAPNDTNDTAGTVVGAQTSMADAKLLFAELSPIDEVLTRIGAGADAVRRFAYRSGAFNRERFEGVVTDYAPDYGMDRDAEHPAGKSLNEIQIVGDLLRAVAWLAGRVAELEKVTPGP